MIRSDSYLLLAMAGFLLLVAINVQVGWLFFVVFALLSVLGTNLVYPAVTLRGLIVERVANDPMEGDPLLATVTLTNAGHSAKYFVTVIDHVPGTPAGEKPTPVPLFFPELLPGKSVSLTYTVPAPRRGCFTFSPLFLESSAPFGYIRWRRRVPLPTPLTVYPRPVRLGKSGVEQPLPLPHVSQPMLKAPGSADDFWGLREYGPGDSLRFVHWRSSARERKLMIKEFRQSARTRLGIVLDATSAAHQGTGSASSLEYAIRVAAGVVDDALRAGHELHLVSTDGVPPYRGTALYLALRFLAAIEPLETTSPQSLEALASSLFTREPGLQDLVVILPVDERGFPPELLRLAEEARQRRVRMLVITLLARSFRPPYPSVRPPAEEHDALTRAAVRAWWVARDPEGVRLV